MVTPDYVNDSSFSVLTILIHSEALESVGGVNGKDWSRINHNEPLMPKMGIT